MMKIVSLVLSIGIILGAPAFADDMKTDEILKNPAMAGMPTDSMQDGKGKDAMMKKPMAKKGDNKAMMKEHMAKEGMAKDDIGKVMN